MMLIYTDSAIFNDLLDLIRMTCTHVHDAHVTKIEEIYSAGKNHNFLN